MEKVPITKQSARFPVRELPCIKEAEVLIHPVVHGWEYTFPMDDIAFLCSSEMLGKFRASAVLCYSGVWVTGISGSLHSTLVKLERREAQGTPLRLLCGVCKSSECCRERELCLLLFWARSLRGVSNLLGRRRPG